MIVHKQQEHFASVPYVKILVQEHFKSVHAIDLLALLALRLVDPSDFDFLELFKIIPMIPTITVPMTPATLPIHLPDGLDSFLCVFVICFQWVVVHI